MSSPVRLTLAISDYDHVRDLVSGRVPVEGVELTCLQLTHEDIFFRFTAFREWDVSELSLAKYASLVAAGDRTVNAIPVFPSRVFRHSAIYVRRGGRVREPADLAGARVGIPEWVQTAGVYVRGILAHDLGVPLESVQWFQTGVNQPGREEQMEVPPNLSLTVVSDRSLSEMLAAGDLDAVISARPPLAAEGPDPVLVPLFEDAAARELDWYRRTGVYPIMHVIALRSAVVEEHPWAPIQLYRAFVEARDRSLDRACDQTASRVPIPLLPAHARHMAEVFVDGLFPYGLEANRRTLETFLLYAHEQGVTARRLEPAELFVGQAESGGRL